MLNKKYKTNNSANKLSNLVKLYDIIYFVTQIDNTVKYKRTMNAE